MGRTIAALEPTAHVRSEAPLFQDLDAGGDGTGTSRPCRDQSGARVDTAIRQEDAAISCCEGHQDGRADLDTGIGTGRPAGTSVLGNGIGLLRSLRSICTGRRELMSSTTKRDRAAKAHGSRFTVLFQSTYDDETTR